MDKKDPASAFVRQPGGGTERLRDMVAWLRGPDGCPWDREQTLTSLKTCLVEEAYELLDAMENSPGDHEEELGDVLLQVVFQAQLREEAGDFDLDDVAHRVAEKLLRRHPHVFGDVTVAGRDEVLRNWEAIKKREREEKPSEEGSAVSALDGVPRSMPALLRAQRTQAKASRVGFDWPDRAGADAKLLEEIEELREAAANGRVEAIEHELGDMLFSVVNICRFMKVDAENVLRAATDRFAKRFRTIERCLGEEGRVASECTLEELDRHWRNVKNRSGEAGM